jgi:transglutaminase-like putative cysteine protease
VASARRTALLLILPAALIAYGWARFERPAAPFWTFFWVALLGCAPALLPRLSLRLAAAGVALLLVLHTALRVSVFDARPHDRSHDFFGPLLSHFERGLGDYYDYTLPFDRQQHLYMHGVALLAVFAGCLSVGLCVAARRPAPAALAVLVWAAWPMTLLTGPGDLRNGACVLVGVLFLLAAVRPVPGRRPGLAVVLTGVLVVAALGASTSPAVAKGEFLNWQGWDFYNRPDNPVGVEYVWNSDYRGITFPKKITTVFRVYGPAKPYYWRATTLDTFYQDGWIEDRGGIYESSIGARSDLLDNPFLPARARDPLRWVKETVTIAALQDPHLVAPATPVELQPDRSTAVAHTGDGVAFAQPPLGRGQSYDVWSYAPEPTPKQLKASKPIYPAALQHFLTLDDGSVAAPFGTVNFFTPRHVTQYEPMYRIAKQVAGRAATPYAATVALEAWFRSNPAFTYNQHPKTPPGVAPLVWFVTQGKQGYCQHFAGAMALMLRSLGIPARVAAGFTSGTYDKRHGDWIVTDHDAHTWVEVWFRGYGWLPFDPTPSRGDLGGTYSSASPTFDAAGAGLLAVAKRLGLTGFAVKQQNDSGFDPTGKLSSTQADVPRHGGGVTQALTDAPRNRSLLRLLALIAVAAIGLVALVKTGLRWGRFLTRDPRRVASACRRELTDFLVDQRIAVPRSATPHELSALVRDELGVDGKAFAAAVAGARFGAPSGAGASARLARRERKRLLRSVRAAVPWPRRLRGLISLRSLGVAR